MLIIDCHAHIYSEDEKKYPTVDKPYRPPMGKGTIKHLQQEMKAAGVKFVTAIQTSTFYRWDNRFIVDASSEHRQWMAGVCTLDPNDDHSPGLLEQYVREANVRGMRSVPAADGRLDHPGVARLWETAEQLGIVINVLANHDKRPQIEAMLKRFRRLRVVVDHCLNIKSGPTHDAILADMLSLAEFPNLHAKLTFIPTGSAEEYPCRDLHESCRKVIGAFEPHRCMWGSDFPCELWCPKVSYGQHLAIFTKELGLSNADQEAILGDTAHRLWFEGRSQR